jgi:hypothetical protein
MSKITQVISKGIKKVKDMTRNNATFKRLTSEEVQATIQQQVVASSVVAKNISKEYGEKAVASAKTAYKKYSPRVEAEVKKFAKEITKEVKETIAEEVKKAKTSSARTATPKTRRSRPAVPKKPVAKTTARKKRKTTTKAKKVATSKK